MPWLYIAVALVLAGAAWILVNRKISLPPEIRTVINVVVVLIFVGILLWLINMYVPMAPAIKAILNIVVVIATCVFVLKAVGLWDDVAGLWNSAKHKAERAMDENSRKNTPPGDQRLSA